MAPRENSFRKAVEARSATPMVYLSTQLPRWVVPVLLVILLLAGLAVTNPLGALAVLPVLAFVCWLAYLSWPTIGVGGRILRIVVIAFLLALIATRLGAF
ncbi:DUF6703 family protein [Nonomuraea sediminis]|uniref:DUF6703 family protein n=1 Tax=Nonomuraea sediminis TaxID=2835864 RepID=UPI001BDC07B9|nr:DUF6703 family protein [Nonomuraea sediminis]